MRFNARLAHALIGTLAFGMVTSAPADSYTRVEDQNNICAHAARETIPLAVFAAGFCEHQASRPIPRVPLMT
jgi:hypothetical protein